MATIHQQSILFIHQVDSHGQHLTNAKYGGVLILTLRSAVTHASAVDGQDRTHTLLPRSLPPRRLHPVLPIPDPTTVIQEFLAPPCPCRYFPSRAVGLNKVNECVSGATAKKYKYAIVSGSIPLGVRNFFHNNGFLRQHSAQNTRVIMEIALLN